MPPPRQLPLLIVLLGLALLGVGVATFVSLSQPATKRALVGGPFVMTADDGHTVTEADFKGEPFLVFFGYTHCPDVCPTSLFELAQVLKALGPDTKLKVLFITIDPERDTPTVMKAYVSSFDPRIIGLSGTPAQTKAIERAYRVYAHKVPGQNGEYTMDHTAIVYLMDKEGRFVTAFNLDRPAKVAAAELQRYF